MQKQWIQKIHFSLDEDVDTPDADTPDAEVSSDVEVPLTPPSDAEVLGAEAPDAEIPAAEDTTTGSKEAYLESTVHS